MPSATLAWLLSQGCRYIVLHCRVLGCPGGGKSVDIMQYVLRCREAATLDQIERAARCKLCGAKGARAEPVIRYEEGRGM